MAVTITNREIISRGSYTLYYADITLDSSYASGGESVNAADFGFKIIKGIWPSHAEGFLVEPVRSSDTAWLLKVYTALTPDTNSALSTPGESSTGRDLSTVTIPCLILGR